jgi:hypothetical protein
MVRGSLLSGITPKGCARQGPRGYALTRKVPGLIFLQCLEILIVIINLIDKLK